jgi:SpoVK/Ycf46/Vps4 family AAA+-type ATPase
VLTVPLGPLASDDHRRAWSQNLPHLRPLASTLAARHPLDPALTAVVAADLRNGYQLGVHTQLADVSAAIRNRAGISLPTGVSLSSPAVTWDHLVLPPEPAQQLRDAVSRLDHQRRVLQDWGFGEQLRAGRGVRMLFTGPPGTGKSLAAAAVARAAQTDLLLVDVARLVSKWIGETEKNLAGAFDVAERTQAVLLLDEADVLFGTRTQIKDSNDRYANLETAYLLQRMDTFDGLVVLTSNLRQNIDAAFLRRVDFLVEFGMPDAEQRARLWRLHLPERARLAEDVDLDVLARMYPVPGAWIRNGALGAAFLAAPGDGPITRAHLLCALRREYAKAMRPYPGEPPSGKGEEWT